MKTRLSSLMGLRGAIRTSEHHRKPNSLGAIIENFYLRDDVSRATAGKKETKTFHKEKMQKRYLLAYLTDIYKKFKEETGINVSYTTFVRYKPFFVLRPKISDRDTCVCRKHANIEFKFLALKKLQVLKEYNKLDDLVDALVCDVKSQQCMYSKCATCERNCINYDFSTTKRNDEVSWLEWSAINVEYKKHEGTKVSKRMTKVTKTANLQNLILAFEAELKVFKTHTFNIMYQFNM